jgi:beta-lactamase superfamily II metal-dependent hydrolase
VRNGFGHPSQDVLERLRERGAWIGQTGESGALTWETDGERVSAILTSPVPAE